MGTPTLNVTGGSEDLSFTQLDDLVVWSRKVTDQVALEDSELVFVGYGVVAPEYGWNDYEGLDMEGKTAVILVNDPGFATQNPELFNGNAMTYYGRWTYKYEEAARQGAAAAIVVHETEPAAYPFSVVTDSWGATNFGLEAPESGGPPLSDVEGWVTVDAARAMFAAAGQDYDALRDAASTDARQSMSLGLEASVAFGMENETTISRNVVGMIPGTTRPDEVLIVTAHWDHFGVSPDESLEDRIYNGAFDNATGTAAVLEIARAMQTLEAGSERTVVFLLVTAEERGLLGSAYYSTDPIFPPAQTVAAINIDGVNVDGSMRDVSVVGYDASELDDVLKRYAAAVGRTVNPEPEPEKGYYYRSDHFPFAKIGIPALYLESGIDHVTHGPEWSMEKRGEYLANYYHQPSDEYDPSWDMSGALDDISLYFAVTMDLANSDMWPEWREGNEFKAIRDASRN
jgi:Zn-dependent M28 family amino/carboxypeptidase